MTGKERNVTTTARGTFDVQLHAMPLEDITKESMLGRMSIDKQFHGDLRGTSKGQMLTVGTPTTGSAVYVAVERIEAELGGRHGTFAVHHRGIMNRGAASLTVSIVPDSGTGGLAGISGSMTIDVKDGEHLYTLEYVLA
jgi:hypothetical protein